MVVRFGRVVLNDVAGQRDQVGGEVAVPVVRENRLQGVKRHGAAKRIVPVGVKMRVRKMQDPHRIS
jgi:hypothetical protein